MQNSLRALLNQLVLRPGLALLIAIWPLSAFAEIEDGQSFRPIQWKSDFSRTNSLSFSLLGLTGGAQLVSMNQKRVSAAYGLQLGQSLRDHWSGRVALFLGRAGDRSEGQFWSFLASDLRRPVLPESYFSQSLWGVVRPYVFFGLGVISQWSQTAVRANLIPTVRYDVSEPAVFAGVQVMGELGDEVLLGLEYRLLQSARASQTRGGALGLSLVWGQFEK